MGIFTRLTDIVNSNINAILDKAEDPDKIIRMIIQEMEDTLVEVRSSAARAIADQKEVERKLGRLAQMERDWEAKAELALSKDREDLAKAALVEKSKCADMAQHLNEELDHLRDALGRHEDDVIKLEAKLREAKAKKATLKARHETVSNHVRVRRNLYSPKIDEAFDRFDKVEARLDRLEGEAEAFELGKGKSLAEEISDLENQEAIENELNALKSRMKRQAQAAEKPAAQSPAKAPAKAAKKKAAKK